MLETQATQRFQVFTSFTCLISSGDISQATVLGGTLLKAEISTRRPVHSVVRCGYYTQMFGWVRDWGPKFCPHWMRSNPVPFPLPAQSRRRLAVTLSDAQGVCILIKDVFVEVGQENEHNGSNYSSSLKRSLRMNPCLEKSSSRRRFSK